MEIDEQEMQERPPSSSLILSKTCQGEDIPRRVLDFIVLSLVRHVFQPFPGKQSRPCVFHVLFFLFLFYIHTGYHNAPRWISGFTWLAFEGRVSLDVLKTDSVSRIVKDVRLLMPCLGFVVFLSSHRAKRSIVWLWFTHSVAMYARDQRQHHAIKVKSTIHHFSCINCG